MKRRRMDEDEGGGTGRTQLGEDLNSGKLDRIPPFRGDSGPVPPLPPHFSFPFGALPTEAATSFRGKVPPRNTPKAAEPIAHCQSGPAIVRNCIAPKGADPPHSCASSNIVHNIFWPKVQNPASGQVGPGSDPSPMPFDCAKPAVGEGKGD